MPDDHATDVLRLCEEALARAGDGRAAYLDAACGRNEDLRREVERLLARHSATSGFLATPPWAERAPRLEKGTRLGRYEIESSLGAGGMGEVYKARDTRLDRTVALKVMPPAVGADAARRARFEREARLVAGLSHPHICPLFDVGEHDGAMFLVMEHLQGETLAARLEQGPLPLTQALTIAAETADALAAAHRQGVIHRDLKPANVMLTKTGAKLLDFGVAKLKGHGEAPAAGSVSSMSTRPAALTAEGTIVGTLQYMAPEQVEGRPADARSDLWALGVIVYEMVTGKRPFEAASVPALIAAILEHEPPSMSSRRPPMPPALERLARKCLAKAPDDRWDSAHDVADELRWIRDSGSAGLESASHPKGLRGWPLALIGTAAIAAVAAGTGLLWLLRPMPPPRDVTRASLDVNPAEELNAGGVWGTKAAPATPGGSRTALSWTPDGRALVFVGRRAGVQQIYVRRLDAEEARPLAGTEGAQVPAVSADGEWIAFWAAGAIRKVPMRGGAVDVLVSGEPYPPMGMSWSGEGLLIGPSGVEFSQREGMRGIRFAPPGNQPTLLTEVRQNETAHVLPQWLPGGRTFVYTARRGAMTWSGDDVVAYTPGTKVSTKLLSDAVDARYAGGYLVFLRRGLLMAVRFDAAALEVQGEPVAVLAGVAQSLVSSDLSAANTTGAGQFAVSPGGMLAYLAGSQATWPDARMVAVDRRGHPVPLPTPVKSYGMNVRVDPDGRRIATAVYGLTEREIWVYDLERGTLLARLGRGGEVSANRSWTPDGKRLVFGWVRPDGLREVAWQPADGATPPEKLTDSGEPGGWAPDGRELLGVRENDIWVLATTGGGPGARPLVESPSYDFWPAVSPDGRWLAYASNASGRFEVHARPYAEGGRFEVISTDGGVSPVWPRSGRELFFLGLPDKDGMRAMMAVPVRNGPGRPFGVPEPLFRFRDADLRSYSTPFPGYDVSGDGQRFYLTQAVASSPAPAATTVHLVLNWFEDLKVKIPAGR